MKFKSMIPKNIDPIELADEIKRDLTKNWIERRSELKSLQGQQSG